MKKVKLLAFIAAILTAFMLFVFLNSLSNRGEIAKTGVFVATKTIPTDTPIEPSMITLSQLPNEAILTEAMSDASLLIGKVAKSELIAGEQILQSRLVTVGNTDESTLSYMIEPGMRAITIAVDGVSGVGYMIAPGNHVDIIAQYTVDKVAATRLLVENVIVLAVDANLSKKENMVDKEISYSTITLQVTPQQVMDLSYYEYTGQLCAVLRSPLDDKKANIRSVNNED